MPTVADGCSWRRSARAMCAQDRSCDRCAGLELTTLPTSSPWWPRTSAPRSRCSARGGCSGRVDARSTSSAPSPALEVGDAGIESASASAPASPRSGRYNSVCGYTTDLHSNLQGPGRYIRATWQMRALHHTLSRSWKRRSWRRESRSPRMPYRRAPRRDRGGEPGYPRRRAGRRRDRRHQRAGYGGRAQPLRPPDAQRACRDLHRRRTPSSHRADCSRTVHPEPHQHPPRRERHPDHHRPDMGGK